jgi:hypothetical protein
LLPCRYDNKRVRFRARVNVRVRVKVMVRFTVKVRVRIKVKVRVRIKVKVRVMFRVNVRIRFNVRVRVRIKVRVRVKVTVMSAKVEVLLSTIGFFLQLLKYIGFLSSRTPHLESGFVPSPSLLQKHSLTGVMSFEVYVSDVIERRFEKVKNGHIFENWTPI